MRATIITAVCLILLASASAQQSKPANPATPSGKAVLEAYVSAWNRHDFAALDKLLTPDTVHEDLAQGVHAQGIAQIKDFMREEIKEAPDLDWRLTTVVDAGPMVAAEWTWTNTYTGDGPTGPVKDVRVAGRGASVVLIENGRIKRFSDYYDFASFFPKAPAGAATTRKKDPPSQELAAGKRTPNGVVQQLFAAWSSHDADKVVALYADDVVYEDVPLGRTSHGRDELRKFVAGTFSAFPDLNVEVVSSSICHAHGVSEVVWSATDKGFLKTDKRFSIRMASVFELHEDKVSRNQDFYDLSTIMRQLGASPAGPPAQ